MIDKTGRIKINKKLTAIVVLVIVLCLFLLIKVNTNTQDPNSWQSIFNGRDLTGWDGDPRLWSVADGAIRGETTPQNSISHNTFCIWRGGTVKDFELKIKFRIQNGNSGIQYRSKEDEGWRVFGYQAEVENAPGNVGFLYDEGGRGWLVNVGDFKVVNETGQQVIGNVSDVNELIEAGYYKEKDWNEYHIIAVGNHIQHYLNGYPTMVLIDNDRLKDPETPQDNIGAAREGLIALQLHVGTPMVVEFKDILLRDLDPKYGDAVVLFNGKNLDNWQVKGQSGQSKWVVGKAALSSFGPPKLVNIESAESPGDDTSESDSSSSDIKSAVIDAVGGLLGGSLGRGGEMINLVSLFGEGVDIYTKERFGDCRIELELMVPRGSNSGIYVMGEYEIQVMDSWGIETLNSNTIGAVFGASPPLVNASKRPGEWQKFIIEFQAPRFNTAGNKTANAKFVRIELNGQLLNENIEMSGSTDGGLTGQEAPTGPLMFQGNHGSVSFRNIIIKPITE